MFRAATCLAVLAAGASCAYTAASGLPAHIRTVRVEVFENLTAYPGLGAELAAAVVREFQVDGTLAPTSRAAGAVLRGRITRVERSVLQEDAFDDAVTGQVTVEAVVSLADVAGGSALLDEELVTSAGTDQTEGIWRLRRGEMELDGLASAVRALAREVVRRAVEAW